MTKRVKTTFSTLREILVEEQTEILKVAGLLMIPSILTKITGQMFTLLAAAQLGTKSSALNEFLLASTFPELLANILLVGAVGAVVIPIFVEVKEKHGKERFLRVYNTVINVSLLIFALVTAGIILFADKLFPLIVEYVMRPTEPLSAESIVTIVAMMRFMMLPMLILGLSVFVTSGLNVYQRFLVPQLAPLFYNLGRIFGVFILIPITNQSPWALAVGVLIGSLLHLLIQIPLARHVGLRYQPVINTEDPQVRKLFRISLPRTFALASEQIGFTTSDFIAGGLGRISLSAFYFANSLAMVIPTIFGYTFAVASFPTLASLYANKEKEQMSALIVRTVNQIVFLALPFVITMMVLRLPLVRLVYGLLPGTEFDRESTAIVAWVLLFWSVGMIFAALKWFLYRVFYVAKNTITPLVISIFALVVLVNLAYMLSNLFSHSDVFSITEIPFAIGYLFERAEGRAAVGGLALAASIVYILEFAMLLWLVNKHVVRMSMRDMLGGIAVKLLPAGTMAALMYFMYKTWDKLALPIDAERGFVGSTTVNLLILTMITVVTSFMVYYLLCLLLQVEDLRILRRFLNPVFRIGGVRIS